MNGSIYLIENTKTGKVYIGQTVQDVNKRFKQHLRLNPANKNQAIYKAIERYGRDCFAVRVLEDGIQDIRTLNEREEYYIDAYNSMSPHGYNLCPGGQKWRRKSMVDDEDASEICRLYLDGHSAQKIGSQFGISKSVVLDTLRKCDIERRDRACNMPDRSSRVTKDQLVEMYVHNNMSVADIAKQLGVCERTVRRAIRRHNLKEYKTE